MNTEAEVQEAYHRYLVSMKAQDKLDKLSRLADPIRNDNPHERAVANAKLAELKATLGSPPVAKDNRGPFQYILEESSLFDKICMIVTPVIFSIWLFGVMHTLSNPTPSRPLTIEEKIKADRLTKIDAAMDALQNERDEIDPPTDYEPDPPDYP